MVDGVELILHVLCPCREDKEKEDDYGWRFFHLVLFFLFEGLPGLLVPLFLEP